MTTAPDAPLRQAVRVLRPGPFRRYMIGESISMTGTWMQAMAQGWVMAQLTHSAFMLGLVNLASGLPMLLLTMVGGSLADRHDKRLILMLTQWVQIALALVMGVLVWQNGVQLWHVLAVAFLLGISNSFEMPAASALVPELVEKDEIASAIAVDRSIFHATRLIGPAVAGAAIGWWGAASAFFANAFTFLALIVALMTLKARERGTPEEEEARAGGIKEGFAYVRQDAPTMAMIGLMTSTTVCIFPVMAIMLPLYASDVLGLKADGMGLLMAVSGVGSLAGSIGLLSVPRHQRGSRLAFGAAGMALSLVVLAFAHSLWAAGAGLALMTVCMSMTIGLANTTVQERAPDHLRGRVSAVVGLSFFGLMPIAGLIVPYLSDRIGMRSAIGYSAVVYAVLAAFVLLGPARRAWEGAEAAGADVQGAPGAADASEAEGAAAAVGGESV